MDFELSDDQQTVLEAVERLLERHAGAERAMALAAKDEYDGALEQALAEAGFFGLAAGSDTGPLEAALLTELSARAAARAAVAARALLWPALCEGDPPGPVALAVAGSQAPVRHAAHARALLVADGDEARVAFLAAGEVAPVPSSFGHAMGRIPAEVYARAEALGRGSGATLRRWWRVALAAEIAGTARAALDVTLDYVKRRRQFGRAIGSFQAVQHRLARALVGVEGARWLALEAADRGAPEEAAAVAAAHAAAVARQVFDASHQLSGAMGFTREHDLHVWSMRLQALRLELGGVAAHRRAAAATRWRASP